MLHRSDWMICPLHALATMIIMRRMPYHSSDRLFTFVTNGQEAKHVNSLFKILFEYWFSFYICNIYFIYFKDTFFFFQIGYKWIQIQGQIFVLLRLML